MTVPIVAPVHRWYCPRCKAEDVTTEARPHTRFHTCPKFGFMSVPMVPAGTKAKIEVNEREDYVGKELVQYNADGRPIMNAVITRDEGTDVAVYAPTATAQVADLYDEAGLKR